MSKEQCALNAKIAESHVDRFLREALAAGDDTWKRHSCIGLAKFWSDSACHWYAQERECETCL